MPEELYHLEQARLLAKQAQKDVPAADWTLQYPAGDARIHGACDEIVRAINDLLRETGIKGAVKARAVSPADLRRAQHERDFDMLYATEARLDDPLRLALLFDPQAAATQPGGSNYLGYDADIKLQELLRAAVKHRQFSIVQRDMHTVHAHLYETMPMVPLWKLDVHVLVQPTLRMPSLDIQGVLTVSGMEPGTVVFTL